MSGQLSELPRPRSAAVFDGPDRVWSSGYNATDLIGYDLDADGALAPMVGSPFAFDTDRGE